MALARKLVGSFKKLRGLITPPLRYEYKAIGGDAYG